MINFDDNNFFNIKFDLIISIQVLYFLSDKDLKTRLESFNKMLRPGGYVFFTMMGKKNVHFKSYSNKRKNVDGLYKVDLSSDEHYMKRHKHSTKSIYINFTKNLTDLKKKFKLFKPVNIGFYDNSLISTKESGYHFTFFGKKNN